MKQLGHCQAMRVVGFSQSKQKKKFNKPMVFEEVRELMTLRLPSPMIHIIGLFYGHGFKTWVTSKIALHSTEETKMLNIDNEEFARRCKALNKEEQMIAAQSLSSEVLVSELTRRLGNLDALVAHLGEVQNYISGELTYGQ